MQHSATEGISVYDDLVSHGDLGTTIHNLQKRNQQLEQHVISLEEDIQKLCNKITEMKHTQENLSRNISELFRTAKNEIDRKDRMIADLQRKLDDVVFRRNSVPNKFQNKRSRDEQANLENDMKKPRYDNKCEIKQDNYENDPRKPLWDKKNDKDEHMGVQVESKDSRQRYNAKTEQKDSRDRCSRPEYEQHRRRRSNSRDKSDRGPRRDHRNIRNRNHSNERDRRYKDNKGEREIRSRPNHHSRNRPEERERFDQNEQRLVPVDSAEAPIEQRSPEVPAVLDLSKEEGELTDVDNREPTIMEKPHKTKNRLDHKSKNHPEDNIPSSNNLKSKDPADPEIMFNVSKFIEKQKELCKKKKKPEKKNENVKNDKKNENDKTKEKKGDSHLKMTKSCNVNVNKIEEEIKQIQLLPEKDSDLQVKEVKPKEMKPKEMKADKISILSNVKLKVETPVVNPKEKSTSEEQIKQNVKSVEIKLEDKSTTEKQITKNVKNVEIEAIPKARESRVPRNLIGDLDIKVEKRKQQEIANNRNELKTKRAEILEKKISSLFDTPIKEAIKSKEKILSPPHQSKCNDEIHFDSKDSSETRTDIKETSTPVTEFQIFKTNLPPLERSNSSIQFQTVSKTDTKTKSEPFDSAIKSGEKVVENESAGYGNTSDIGNISLDFLNAEICNYKPEDFPNMLALSTSRDVPTDQKPNEKSSNISNKSIENLLLTPNFTKEKNESEEKCSNDPKEHNESVNSINTTNSSVITNSSPTPNTTNVSAKRKRRRCVMKWKD